MVYFFAGNVTRYGKGVENILITSKIEGDDGEIFGMAAAVQ